MFSTTIYIRSYTLTTPISVRRGSRDTSFAGRRGRGLLRRRWLRSHRSRTSALSVRDNRTPVGQLSVKERQRDPVPHVFGFLRRIQTPESERSERGTAKAAFTSAGRHQRLHYSPSLRNDFLSDSKKRERVFPAYSFCFFCRQPVLPQYERAERRVHPFVYSVQASELDPRDHVRDHRAQFCDRTISYLAESPLVG